MGRYRVGVLVPLLLITGAVLSAAAIAFGVHPGWADLNHGLQIIVIARRLQWPLVVLCLALCMVLLGLVIGGKRRAWWLIGLAPVLALFFHRFAPRAESRLFITETPIFVQADHPSSPHEDEYVVGVVFQDVPYALPYRDLFSTPIVFITDYDKRMVVMWSAYANRATASTINRELRPRDLEIVSTPADTLLVYHRRLGQFIAAITGRTLRGEKPAGMGAAVPTTRTTWGAWRKAHPTTRVMAGMRLNPAAPAAPILPRHPKRLVENVPAETRVAIVGGASYTAIAVDHIGRQPLNGSAGELRVVVVRDPSSGELRVFDRNVAEDLFATFTSVANRRGAPGFMVDSDSGTLWTADGRGIEGPLRGSRLREVPIEQNLYWGPMKFWHPALRFVR